MSSLEAVVSYRIHHYLPQGVCWPTTTPIVPQVLMNLMPDTERLTTEHIKSHLQKYRLHYTRSKDEFLEFYELRLKEKFAQFCTAMQWRDLPPHLTDEAGTGSFNHFKQHTPLMLCTLVSVAL
jgi:hypothetical protein